MKRKKETCRALSAFKHSMFFGRHSISLWNSQKKMNEISYTLHTNTPMNHRPCAWCDIGNVMEIQRKNEIRDTTKWKWRDKPRSYWMNCTERVRDSKYVYLYMKNKRAASSASLALYYYLRNRMNCNLMTFAVSFLHGWIVCILVRYKVCSFDLTTVWIFALSIEDFFV